MSGPLERESKSFEHTTGPFIGSSGDRVCIVNVSPLLREVIVHLTENQEDLWDNPLRERLIDLLFELLRELPQVPFRLPTPSDERARRVAEAVLENPGDVVGLTDLAAEAGASSRTVHRLFLRETGMTFRLWREQARLHRALVLLAERKPVSAVASRVGYASASAFCAMFRRALGQSPGRFFRD